MQHGAAPYSLATLARSTLVLIVEFCDRTPMQRHNGIATCNRYASICWRQTHPPYSLSTLDKPILDLIVEFCATSPMQRHNGIASCNRYANICWRQMHLELMRSMCDSIANSIFDTAEPRETDVLVFDLMDIM